MYGLPLEVTLIEAHGLKNVSSSMDVYAVVSLTGDSGSQKFKSIVDRDCGSHPKWNQTFKFTVDENAAKQGLLFLTITIKSDKSFAVDPVIGEIRLPIRDLLNGYDGTGNELKFVSYGVIAPSGKVKGSLEMNYKFGGKLAGDTSGSSNPPPPMGYPSQSNAYPPPGGNGYPGPYPAQGYSSPHGYPAPAPGYGYQQHENPQKVKKHKKDKKKRGIGKAIGATAGFLGGLILGEAMELVGDAVGVEGAPAKSGSSSSSSSDSD